MQTKERHAHAMECYYVTSRRCGALLQWISQVISYTYSQNGRFAPILLEITALDQHSQLDEFRLSIDQTNGVLRVLSRIVLDPL